MTILLSIILACGPGVHMTYLDTSPDSAGMGTHVDEYIDVADLPPCEGAWVRLPPTSDEVDREIDQWRMSEVHEIVYGDPDWSGPPAKLYPVVYRTFAQDDHQIGWEVNGIAELYQEQIWTVVYAMFDGWTDETQPFTLVCPGKDW